jgi:hypothetical protein
VSLRAVVLLQPARRPVVLRRIAAAGAVQRGDVLERHEDVPVELDVGHFLHVAVGGQHAFLVLAAEKRNLDLLALVLVRVVLDGSKANRFDSPGGSSRWYRSPSASAPLDAGCTVEGR